MRLRVVFAVNNGAITGVDPLLKQMDRAAAKRDLSDKVREFVKGSLHLQGVFDQREVNVDPYRSCVLNIIVSDPPTHGMTLECDPRIAKDTVLEQNVEKIFVVAQDLPPLRQFLGAWELDAKTLVAVGVDLPRLPASKAKDVPVSERIRVTVALSGDGTRHQASLETLEGPDEVTHFALFTLALKILHGLTLDQATKLAPLPLSFSLPPPIAPPAVAPEPSQPGKLELNLTGLAWDGAPPTHLTGTWYGPGPAPAVSATLLKGGADPTTAEPHPVIVVPVVTPPVSPTP